MSWTRALHFKSWADTQDARHTLPLLIRRLIRAIVPTDAIVIFPANEQVQRPGLDGIVEVTVGNQFVPYGKSAWEMGVNSNKKNKAEKDFNKRTTSTTLAVKQETTFIFVTPREWQNKDDWAEEKRGESDWKDVVVLDANDLEHWIELCPAVDVWFSTMSGRRPEGLIDLAARWNAISCIAKHPLSPQVVLTSRDSSCNKLLTWFSGAPASILLKSESAEDGLDFLSAFAFVNLKDSPYLERMFVVNNINAWRALSVNHEPLILLAATSLPLHAEDISEAVTAGHHVLISGGRMASPLATELQLPRQESYSITTELKNCGFDDSKARSLALACCGSSTVLKRLLTRHPQTTFPEWSKDENRTALAPLALLGGWMHVNPEPREDGIFPTNTPIDLLCIEDFMGISRETLECIVSRWCGNDEPLFLRFRDHIVVGSREDAWYLLGSAITPQMLNRFEDLASLVLEEDNPALDLDSKDRWMANIHGKTHSLSGEIRQGIVESLVLMTVYPTAGNLSLNVDFGATVRKILNRVLPEGATWKRWATFDRQLQLFAEADPDFLLSRIDSDLKSNTPQIPFLFENGSTGLFSSTLHCGLLWSLEIIAWNPAQLGRVTDILARLIEIEQALPHNMGNRPSSTLNEIYLWWLPHTNATINNRITGLQQLIANHPDVGWKTLIELLPSGTQSSSSNTQMPRWRDWAVGWSREKVHRESYDYPQRIAMLTIETASESPEKWSQMIDGIFRYGDDVAKIALKKLSDIATHNIEQSGRLMLWKKLQKIISRHQAYSSADWTFSDELLQQLSVIRDQLKPDDPIAVNEWLFDYHPHLPNVDRSDGYELYQEKLEEYRANALQHITSLQGWGGIAELIQNVPDVNTVGWLIGREGYLNPEEVDLWSLLESEDTRFHQFASLYIAGAFKTRSFNFLEQLELETKTPRQAATALCSIPFDRPTWDWIDSNLDQVFRDEYWSKCRGFVLSKNEEDLAFAVERLLQVRRPFTASDLLQMAMQNIVVDNEMVFRVLEAGLSTEKNQENVNQLDSYATQQLIKHLQEHSFDQLSRLARIEWGYLPLLDRHSSEAQPVTLIQELQTSPMLFVDMLKIVYRGANEEPREVPLTELEQSQHRHANDLLDVFSKVPGMDENGIIDEEHLKKWTSEVRSLAEQEDRLRVADHQLGHLLSRFPRHENEDWPPLPICRIMEHSESEHVLYGFTNGLENGRGVTCRCPTEGGVQERQLAASYRIVADQHQGKFPKLAEAFRRLAESYERHAEQEDSEAERRRLER